MKRLWLFILLIHGYSLSAQEVHDSVRIHFRQGRIELIPSLHGNQVALDRIADSLQTNYTNPLYRLKKVMVVGGASPEGSIKFNQWLSEKRAGVLFNYLSRYGELPDSLKTFRFLGRDWKGLSDMVEKDMAVPFREETLKLLADIIAHGGMVTEKGDPLVRLQRLKGGVPYRYLYRNCFPELRAARLHLWYEKAQAPAPEPAPAEPVEPAPAPLPPDTVYVHDTLYMCPPCKPFYMDVRTNMLHDLAGIPDIGVEFYLGKGWSIAASWMYGWWKTDRRHRYWRAYGGDVTLRRWLGRAAKEKPLTGHHLGVYARMLTYDFEWGGRGYMGGKPGGTLWEKANWGAGVEYGYSLPVAHRLNLDFTLGMGYLGGTQYEYLPEDNCYVWQCTRTRHWFGPAKAEISLVWLIGCDNYNRRKGGKR